MQKFPFGSTLYIEERMSVSVCVCVCVCEEHTDANVIVRGPFEDVLGSQLDLL
jgi:hypothetical protein